MTVPDLRALLATFADHRVEYVVIGGIALVLHGGLRTTEDLDIVPDPDPANLDRLCQILQAMDAVLLLNPARPFGAREAELLKQGRNVSLSTRYGDVDVVRTLAGVPGYAALANDAERYEIDGVTLLAASPQKLIAMKQFRGSAQDQADIETLRILEEQGPARPEPGER
ncbi:MAG TPA: DUF6036 family nucleotidyltransferase [Gaiellaceae bacterium]|nr:DUF6036 family nucleotidyltransferase [Gaiellaceae bacterium]